MAKEKIIVNKLSARIYEITRGKVNGIAVLEDGNKFEICPSLREFTDEIMLCLQPPKKEKTQVVPKKRGRPRKIEKT